MFANWAKMLLQDFNEIDRYLLEPNKVFGYLKAIEDIKHWSVDMEQRTDMITNYLLFWDKLPDYYSKLYDKLLSQGVGYQGLIYREAVANLDYFTESVQKTRFVFAGFNALNAAEEKIIQHLLACDCAKIFWDIDNVFLKDHEHDAGLFIRRFKDNWKHYRSRPFEWISNEFADKKRIHVIGTPKSIGQAKIAGTIIEDFEIENPSASLDKTAVVSPKKVC
ncbi:MAG: hypothetical protein EOP48_19345 [Sphingobacteriales bacterium]|nr:MAG: hypothetical protein EOP48_19345 [Sphingobacteriales bacterium]